jgi:L-2,4-diaminobutyrate decarboxylase
MSSVPPAIADAYDPERFRADGHRVIDAIADALTRWHRREGKVLPWQSPAAGLANWGDVPPGSLVEDLGRVMAGSTALANPRCMGHQVPPPLPAAALAELVSALCNNGMAVYEMGPASVPIEMNVIRWLCDRLGYSDRAGGVLTSGGSLGNLTALLAMRQAHSGINVWKQGAHSGPPLAVIVGADAHYSVARALRVMGWGDGGVIVAPLDKRHRMGAAAVRGMLELAQGRRVVGIVAAAGSTATGAFDPIDELAQVAHDHNLWLHVDAAHGASVALSPGQRHKLAGIEAADSVVWDTHKLMMMPALVTAVLFRQGGHSYDAFAQQASYLFAGSREETWWDLGTRTLECTKRMMAIEVWSALRAHGADWFGDVVDRQMVLAAELAARIERADDFELALVPECNIVCYRHKPRGMTGAALDAHNKALRQRVVEDGTFYVVGVQLDGSYWLRSTIMNPLTEPSDFDALLEHLRSLCPR